MCKSNEKKCVICKSPLNEGAIQCLACKGFQHPVRRFLSNLDIKSLVALVPIITLAFAFLQDRFSVHESHVIVRALDCTDSRIELVATNTGERPGIIKAAKVMVYLDDDSVDEGLRLKNFGRGSTAEYMVVNPEEQVFLTMSPMVGQAVAPLRNHPAGVEKCTYRMAIEIIEFQQQSNEKKIIHTSCNCPR
jgi:hypothetical protein